MTDKPTPTDAELKAMWQLHAADIGGIFYYARAVLQRWGQPSGAGEAAEHYRNAIASACEGWTMPDGLRKHLETALWSPPTPQPTQAQAGAGEVVAWRYRMKGDLQWQYTERPEQFAHADEVQPLTTPQPTQAQAGAVPLTDEQIRAMLNKHPPEDVCGWSYRMGIDDAELHHGIKGGQHGTE